MPDVFTVFLNKDDDDDDDNPPPPPPFSEGLDLPLCIGESLLTSLFTFFLISIRLNSQKPWPYI